jgi:hypothetical protein
MKKQVKHISGIAILATLLTTTAARADFPIPTDLVSSSSDSTSSIPDSKNIDDYVKFFANRIENIKKAASARNTAYYPADNNVECLSYNDVPDAYTIKKTADNKYDVYCLAGPDGKSISHMLKYSFTINYVPFSCMPTDSDVKAHFQAEALRGANYARAYYNSTVATCQITASMSSSVMAPGQIKPKPHDDALTADYINKNLMGNAALKPYIGVGDADTSVSSSDKKVKTTVAKPGNMFTSDRFSDGSSLVEDSSSNTSDQ